jgi:putative sporulation protein YtaF
MFVLSANIDNFVLGFSYGVKKIKIGFLSSLLIYFLTFAGTAISMAFGKIIFTFIPARISGIIGGAILAAIGVWSLLGNFIKSKKDACAYGEVFENPEKADKDHSGTIDLKESLALGFALSANNLGLGLGASISGLNIYLVSIMTFIVSAVFLVLGTHLGKKISKDNPGKWAAIISGLIMIALGIYEMFL